MVSMVAVQARHWPRRAGAGRAAQTEPLAWMATAKAEPEEGQEQGLHPLGAGRVLWRAL